MCLHEACIRSCMMPGALPCAISYMNENCFVHLHAECIRVSRSSLMYSSVRVSRSSLYSMCACTEPASINPDVGKCFADCVCQHEHTLSVCAFIVCDSICRTHNCGMSLYTISHVCRVFSISHACLLSRMCVYYLACPCILSRMFECVFTRTGCIHTSCACTDVQEMCMITCRLCSAMCMVTCNCMNAIMVTFNRVDAMCTVTYGHIMLCASLPADASHQAHSHVHTYHVVCSVTCGGMMSGASSCQCVQPESQMTSDNMLLSHLSVQSMPFISSVEA